MLQKLNLLAQVGACLAIGLLSLVPQSAFADWVDTDDDRINTTPAPGEVADSTDEIDDLYRGGFIPPDLTYGCNRNDQCPNEGLLFCRTVTVGETQHEALVTVNYSGVCTDAGQCEITGVGFEELCGAETACYVAVADEGPQSGSCIAAGEQGDRVACQDDADCFGTAHTPGGGIPPLERRSCEDEDSIRIRSYSFCIRSRNICHMQANNVVPCIDPLKCVEDEANGQAGCVFGNGDDQVPRIISPATYVDDEEKAQLRVSVIPGRNNTITVVALADDLDLLNLGQKPIFIRLRVGDMWLAGGGGAGQGQLVYSPRAQEGDDGYTDTVTVAVFPDRDGHARALQTFHIFPQEADDCADAVGVAIAGEYLVDVDATIVDADGAKILAASHIRPYVRLSPPAGGNEPRPPKADACEAQTGCTDPAAENFDPDAEVDDGFCTYVSGCTDPGAENYDANAYMDDTSCTYPAGCTDPWAENFDPDAYMDDASCAYAMGCTDPLAENYDPVATTDDLSCTYAVGCTDEWAVNYEPDAWFDDGSCDYSSSMAEYDY